MNEKWITEEWASKSAFRISLLSNQISVSCVSLAWISRKIFNFWCVYCGLFMFFGGKKLHFVRLGFLIMFHKNHFLTASFVSFAKFWFFHDFCEFNGCGGILCILLDCWFTLCLSIILCVYIYLCAQTFAGSLFFPDSRLHVQLEFFVISVFVPSFVYFSLSNLFSH